MRFQVLIATLEAGNIGAVVKALSSEEWMVQLIPAGIPESVIFEMKLASEGARLPLLENPPDHRAALAKLRTVRGMFE